MSTVTLVRHGQALAFQRENSRLTSVGEAQAARLAEFWLRAGVRFDEVYCGALPRQVQTHEVVCGNFRDAGQEWPEVQTDSAWNEYDAPGVLRHFVPAGEIEQARSGPDPSRAFQRIFEAAMLCWLDGRAADGVEPWTAFCGRVSGALRRLMAGPPGRNIAVFTSGGVIGFAIHFAMQSPPRSFLDVNWRVRNASLTRFVFDRERFTLDSFNEIAHLDDPALRTYR